MSPERRRLYLLLAGLAVVVVIAFRPSSSTPPAAVRSADPRARRGRAGTSPDAVPTLVSGVREEREALPSAVARDPFHFWAPPTKVPTPVPPTPTPKPAPGTGLFIGPLLPTPSPTPTPIIPPAIPYKFIGVFGPPERPIAAFEDNGRLINAREKDILDGKFILRKVNQESIDFAFVGLPANITRRLPLATSEPGK